VLDELLKGCNRLEDLLGNAGLMEELKNRLMEQMLGAEPTAYLGDEAGGEPPAEQSKRRNGVAMNRGATIPVVCRNGNLNGTLMVRQSWIAASENTAGRPGLSSGVASQVISLSSQIRSDPRLRREAM